MFGFDAARGILNVARKISGLSTDEFQNALRLLAFLLIAVLLLGGLAEWYRGALRLNRLEQETEILMQLQETGEHPSVQRDSQIAKAHRELEERLRSSAESHPGLPEVGTPTLSPRAVQVFHGMLPWILFAILLFAVPELRPEKGERWKFLSGLILFLVVFIVPFIFVPLDWPSSVRKWVLPFGGAILAGWLLTRFGPSGE